MHTADPRKSYGKLNSSLPNWQAKAAIYILTWKAAIYIRFQVTLYFRFTEHSTLVRLMPIIYVCFRVQTREWWYKPSLHAVRLCQTLSQVQVDTGTNTGLWTSRFGGKLQTRCSNQKHGYYRFGLYIHEQEPELLNLMWLRAASERCNVPSGKSSRMSSRFFPLQNTSLSWPKVTHHQLKNPEQN